MNKLKKTRIVGFSLLLMIVFLLIAPFSYSTNAVSRETALECANGRCEQLKAKLKKLETNPDNLTKKEFLRRVKAACNEMRRRKCPSIKNYEPNICFTDF